MSFELNWEEKGVEIVVEGDFPNQMVSINKALRHDPRSKSIRYIIFDVTRADVFLADAGLLSTLAELDFEAYRGGPHVKVAVVSIDEKMAHITSVYAAQFRRLNPDGADYCLFEDVASARTWIGLDTPAG